MKKLFAILISLILCVSAVPAMAVDAVSSATVGIESFPELTEHEETKNLVIYFSTNDTVKAVALVAADALEADVFEVIPEQPYTEADLAYYTGGRCDQEQDDPSARPGIADWPESLDRYDVVLIGYPIWHGQAPKILYTLLEGIDLSGKTVVPFATSGGSDIGDSAKNMQKLAPGAKVVSGKRFNASASAEALAAWAGEWLD